MGLKGTIGSAAKKNLVGGVPYRHYQDGFMNPRRINLIDSCSFQRYEQFRFGTRGCPITCRATYKIRKEDGTTLSGEAMQANTIQDFGYKLDIVDPAAIIQANLLCNAYGLDMDTCAESIAWAFECYEAGLINNRDTGGISLRWGNSSAVLQLITEIAYRVGFGDTLAEGSKIAAEILGRGSSELAVTMKGQDLYETMRSPKGYGLGAALSSRGGGHCSGSPISEFSPGRWSHSKSLQLYGVKTAFDPTSYDGKGQLVAFYEGFHTVLNSLGICFHATIWQHPDLLNWDDLSELVTTATGWNTEVDELMQIGERIHTIERLTNVNQAGITMSDDYPPSRFFCNPIRTGPFKGEKLDKAAYKDMLRENYSQHGWSDIGIPKQETLKALGIQGLGREESEASPIGVND
jgi:aldehyde:ferredoxin oxidoreductase